MSDLTLTVREQAHLEQVVAGLLPVTALPGVAGDVYLDEEGTPIGRRELDAAVGLRTTRFGKPADLRGSGPVVVAIAGRVPMTPIPPDTTVLLATAGVRLDDARHNSWASAWTVTASRVIELPLVPDEVAARADELAAAYSSGARVEVETADQPRGIGRTVMLSGLSGSGKSTIARALVERLGAKRAITLLDGDVVRTHLSRGLGFSRTDRDLNIRRIGWVAGEITKHGGVAVCAPIAPYDETRKWVRTVVDEAGGPGSFLLVWVSTPLEECERRDVKGLYAKARAGELKGFTGIDDPYEAPDDAELSIDTTAVSVTEAVDQIVALLSR